MWNPRIEAAARLVVEEGEDPESAVRSVMEQGEPRDVSGDPVTAMEQLSEALQGPAVRVMGNLGTILDRMGASISRAWIADTEVHVWVDAQSVEFESPIGFEQALKDKTGFVSDAWFVDRGSSRSPSEFKLTAFLDRG